MYDVCSISPFATSLSGTLTLVTPPPPSPSFLLVSPFDYDDVPVHGTNTSSQLNGTFDYDNVRVHGTNTPPKLNGTFDYDNVRVTEPKH